jgi:DNA polymerase-4
MAVYFHVDLDAFYASVEQHDDPQLRGKPVIVGGQSQRGVVSACSYEARVYGVHSAMPIFQARKLCPHGIYVPVRMKRYAQVSAHIMTILDSFSPHVQQISIDEAFLDMSGTQTLFGPPLEAAQKLKDRIRTETGLTASVGIGSNKYVAKMASDKNKPDGICYVRQGEEYDFISSMKLEKLWGIGKKGLSNLHSRKIFTIDALRGYSLDHLQRLFGNSSGEFYFNAVRGIDPGIFSAETKSRSVGNEITLEEDTRDEQKLRMILLQLSHHVMYRMMRNGLTARTVGVKYKLYNFTSHTAQTTPAKPIYSAEEIFHHAWKLFDSRWDHTTPIRLIGISLQSVDKRSRPLQDELFDDQYKKKRLVEETALKLKTKGRSIMKATDLLLDPENIDKKKE